MKIKAYFYSLSGNARLIAETLKNEKGVTICELAPKKAFPAKGFKKFFIGGKSILFKETPQLLEYDKNIDYDVILLITPIWAGCFAPPIRSFLCENDLNGKKLALIETSMSENGVKNTDRIKKLQPKAEIIGSFAVKDPKSKDTDVKIKELIAFIDSLPISI